MKNFFKKISSSTEETENIGRELARRIKSEHNLEKECVFIAFYGGLGAGKTAFVRGLAAELIPGAAVSSPTYAIVNEYRNSKLTLAHFDMYRVAGEDDLLSCAFDDYFRPGVVIAAEWCENIVFALPGKYYKVEIELINEKQRIITIKTIGCTA